MAQRRLQEPIVHFLARNQAGSSSAGSGASPGSSSSAQSTRRRRASARQIHSSSTSTVPNYHEHHRELNIGLRKFFSASSLSPCRLYQHRRLYASVATARAPRMAPAATLDRFSTAEQDEIFFELASSPPPPMTEDELSSVHGRTAVRPAKSTTRPSHLQSQLHSHFRTSSPYHHSKRSKILTGPPESSRQVLWDWRRWTSLRKRTKSPVEENEEAGAQKLKTTKKRTSKLGSGKGKGKQTRKEYVKRRRAELTPELTAEDPFFHSIQEYQKHFLPAIQAEQLEDARVLNERLATWDVKRLKDEGYCLTDMSAFWMQKNQFGKPTANFLVGPGVELPEHRFEKGTHVLLSRIDPLTETPYHGSVVSTTASQIRVCFHDRFQIDDHTWRLDVGRPDLVFERMRAAVGSLSVDVDETLRLEAAANARTLSLAAAAADSKGSWGGAVGGKAEWKEYILQGTALRDVLLKGFEPERRAKVAAAAAAELVQAEEDEWQDRDPYAGIDFEDEEEAGGIVLQGEGVKSAKDIQKDAGIFHEDQRIQSWARRYSLPTPLVMDGDMPLPGLNPSQIKAMAMMVGNRVSLVQGPPGTGKTNTIIQTLKLLKLHFGVPQPILVCTYTNVAVDNLVEGIASAGLRPLRVGFGPSIRTALLEHSLHYKLEKHPRNPELVEWVKEEEKLSERASELAVRTREVREQIDEGGVGVQKRLEGRLRNMNAAKASLARQIGAFKAKIYALQQEMLADVIGESDVICTTCITAATSALSIVDFPIVFLDEASMSTEPASLIPLMKGCRHLALIGDHKQLPPVIISKEAQEIGLGISLFERLTREGDTPSVMLDTQYRMHPGISLFPSTEFYLGGVRDGTVDADGNVQPGLSPPRSLYLRALAAPKSKAFVLGEGEEEGVDGAWASGVNDSDEHDVVKEEDVFTLSSGETKRSKQPSVIFLDHAGNETMKDRSRVNHPEAHIIASVVVDLLLSNPELRGSDIGIIAPYVAQQTLLTRIFNTHPQYQAQFKATLGDTLYMQLEKIEIKTVDGFEGREKEVILFSTVRNNGGGHIGFLADRRRLNVGLTRAKRALFVVGSIRTLKEGKISGGEETARVGKGAESWRRYAQYLMEQGLVVSVRGDAVARGMGVVANSAAMVPV